MDWPVNKDEILNEITQLFEHNTWWYYKGEKVKEFETSFAKAHGCEFGVATCNGTVPLEIVLRGLGIGAGDKVILPAYNFYSLPKSVLNVGAEPVFVDVLPSNLTLDPEQVLRKLDEKGTDGATRRVKAVVAVHISSSVAKLDELQEICQKAGVHLIEDCAQSAGAVYDSRPAGSWGVAGLFSFGGVKLMTSGQGGMIVTSQPELAEKCYAAANRGMNRDGKLNRFGIIGDNYQMSELAAAILIPQLRILGDLCQKREQIMARLDQKIGSISGIRPFKQFSKTTFRAQMRYCFFDENALNHGASAAEFIRRANEAKIPFTGGHRAVSTDNALFNRFASAGDFPVAQQAQDAIVAIHHTEILRGFEYWEDALGRVQELI